MRSSGREGGREQAQSRAELKPESIKQTPLTLGPPQPLHCCRPLGPHSGPHGRSSRESNKSTKTK